MPPTNPPITITNPFIPPGSLILATGANGLIASHVVDQFLSAGYLVRGTVRSASRCSYLSSLFAARHGPGRFELFEVPDKTAPGAWDEAMRGVSGIAHTIGMVDFDVPDADAAAEEELRWQVRFLEAAARQETVRAVAWNSTAWAAWTPNAVRKVTLTVESWNEEAVQLARDKTVDSASKGLAGFMAAKTILEKRIWEWVNETKPRFAFNAVLLNAVLGECLDPVNQGFPSSAGMVHNVWKNRNVDVLNMVPPQWFVDCRDAGRLHVALLGTSPVVDRERIFGFGHRYSWFRVAEILKELYPEHANKMAKVKDLGWDQTEVPNQRGAELLARMGQHSGWRTLEESIAENGRSFPELVD
ncbi:NAD(P)-binding protein [Canariomyces notabilis]|uniref:NAD(P)-binding protein n=1 Tax=Canariomyces notabilis TaxID=2074819 RepID=A0AAN6YU97_9PEZI|nr:NAD(P)-binding protein [Canariomyces arenarius]